MFLTAAVVQRKTKGSASCDCRKRAGDSAPFRRRKLRSWTEYLGMFYASTMMVGSAGICMHCTEYGVWGGRSGWESVSSAEGFDGRLERKCRMISIQKGQMEPGCNCVASCCGLTFASMRFEDCPRTNLSFADEACWTGRCGNGGYTGIRGLQHQQCGW